MAAPTLRLEDCGDFLTVKQYAAWTGKSIWTIYDQVRRGRCKVPPHSLKPLEWSREACQRYLDQPRLARDRAAQARARLAVAS